MKRTWKRTSIESIAVGQDGAMHILRNDWYKSNNKVSSDSSGCYNFQLNHQLYRIFKILMDAEKDFETVQIRSEQKLDV
jgi:hypothetical protein